MARPFYSAPVKYRPDFPFLPGQVRVPPPHVLTGPPPPPPPPGVQPPGFTSDKPWMTPHLVAEIRRRNFLQNQAARSSSEQDRAAAEQQRQRVNRLVNDAKERFCLAHPERTDEILASDRRARPFHCGSCDRSYGTQQQLDEHCREHVRCGLDDCPFTAHPKVVEKHVTMQHDAGLAKVIMALNTPEAIARWREQRRANFCRPESAAKRQAEQAERTARGIRLSAARGRFPPAEERPGRGRGGSRGRGRGRGGSRGRGARSRPAQQHAPLSDSEGDEDGVTARGLPCFSGILAAPTAAVAGDPDTAGDDGDSAGSATGPAGTEATTQDGEVRPARVTAAGGPERTPSDTPVETRETADRTAELQSNLSVNDDEVGTAASPDPTSAAVESASAALTDRLSTTTTTTTTTTTSGPRPVSPSDHRSAVGAGPGGRGRGRGRGRGQAAGIQQPPRKRRRPLTLLEKLLAPDIRRERNIILQCVRHVVNEGFFDGRPLGGARPASPAAAAAGAGEQEAAGSPCALSPEQTAPPGPGDDPEVSNSVPGQGTAEPDSAPGRQTAEPDSVPDRQTAEPDSVPGQQTAELADAAGTSPKRPVPRLLSGAYYDSDAITDSD